ncbi:MAG TPA: hypothetical protein VL400_00020 [Polyangiaceae bacterium]|jgi:hypothetical protein|nr:hypothetical protein [Polyangiaceae bacterium]
MELETVTRPMDVFRERVKQVGGDLGLKSRRFGVVALRRGAGALATTATKLDGLADRIDATDASTAAGTAAPAEMAVVADAPVEAEAAPAWADAPPPDSATSDFEIEAEEAEPLVTVREKKSKKR